MVRPRLHKCTRPRPSALPTFSYSVAPANGLVEGWVFSAHRSDRTGLVLPKLRPPAK